MEPLRELSVPDGLCRSSASSVGRRKKEEGEKDWSFRVIEDFGSGSECKKVWWEAEKRNLKLRFSTKTLKTIKKKDFDLKLLRITLERSASLHRANTLLLYTTFNHITHITPHAPYPVHGPSLINDK
ncbi:hypothetical protein EJ110_NYTH00010 [Nymphaea thermarum]|nr:hypothetical protein EJ110_NYTH00010 [Nymphaea thermarum]